MDLVPLNAFTVFLGIAAVGFLFLMVSLFFGEIFEHFDAALRPRSRSWRARASSARASSACSSPRSAALAPSRRTRALVRLPPPPSAPSRGLLLAAPVYFLARFLYGQQATSETRTQDLVGKVGRVVVAIPAGGVGQVRCTIGEELVDKIARGPRAGGDRREHAGRRRGSRRRNRRRQTPLRRGNVHVVPVATCR